MTSVRFTPPEPVELVPAEEVRAVIEASDRELSALELRVVETVEAADLAEVRAREMGVDGRSSTWAMVRLQRFLDELRAEAERDAEAMVDVARENARLRVEDARADADRDRERVPPLIAAPSLESGDHEFWNPRSR